MRKITILFTTIAFLSACKNEKWCLTKNNIFEKDSNVKLANPMHKCNSAEEVAKMCGLNLPKVLSNFRDINFFVIDKKTAQMNFSFDKKDYSFRMAKDKVKNLAGYYVNFESAMCYSLGKEIGYANINYNEGKEGVISWFDEKKNISYSFSTPQVTDAEEFKVIIINLMKSK